MDITNEVIKKAKELGADMVGIAPVERFKGAPLRMSPKGLLPSARSVIVCAIHHLDASIELGGEPTPHNVGPYGFQGIMNSKLDDISFSIARFLEDKGYTAVPITASNIWRYSPYKDIGVSFAPDIAHRYAAVAAGLGEIGWSGLFLTKEFGPRQRVVSIITDAQLLPSPMYNGPSLCDKCMECVKNCPTDAYRKEVNKINEIEIGGKVFKFPDINKWRCAWAENFGLNLALKIPEKINENVILEYTEKYGYFAGEEGCCLKFCMVPEKRYYDKEYCRAPRRKKEPSISEKDLLEKIKNICRKRTLDVYGIEPAELFCDEKFLHPYYHLPDVKSVISLGVHIPNENKNNEEFIWALQRNLGYAAFDISHYLDIGGYSAITGTKIDDILVAQKMGIYEKDTLFLTVLTSMKLKKKVFFRKETCKRNIKKNELKDFCFEAGADMAGVFNIERFEKFKKEFEKKVKFPEKKEIVVDKGGVYGHFVPDIRTECISLKGPDDYLKDARSVIVIGLHFPHSVLDYAKVTPAETTGPYVFSQVETITTLKDIGVKIIKYLNFCGYKGVMTPDLTGLASQVLTKSRGNIPDMSANLYPALLAGLAYPGLHGYPITERYGTRQRFLAIVTDCPLENDPLPLMKYACEKCEKFCISFCPTKAITKKTVKIKVEGREFYIPLIDDFSCDWAKRYGLSGDEGLKYYGIKTDIPVPKNKKIEEVVKAINNVNWGVQKRHANVCEECIRVCPEKGRRNGKK